MSINFDNPPKDTLYIAVNGEAAIFNNAVITLEFFKFLNENQSKLENETVNLNCNLIDNIFSWEDSR